MLLYVESGAADVANRLGLKTDFGQPEIENLRLTSIRNEDVCWFDVPVDDPFRVCGVKAVCDLDAEVEHCFHVQRLSSHLVLEGLAFQILHAMKGLPSCSPIS